MKKTFFVIAASLFFGMTSEAYADQCESWTHKAYPVTMEACSYASGGSGYARITNEGDKAASICWTVVFNDGSETNGCYSNMPAGESTSPSCSRCGFKNAGAKYILLKKYQTM